jgi:hypothetical protein
LHLQKQSLAHTDIEHPRTASLSGQRLDHGAVTQLCEHRHPDQAQKAQMERMTTHRVGNVRLHGDGGWKDLSRWRLMLVHKVQVTTPAGLS